MDEQRLRSFLLARGLLDRAQAAMDGTPPGNMAAIVLYDLAVETGAKAAAAVHRPKGFPGRQSDYILTKSQRDRSLRRDPSLQFVLDELLAAAREVTASDDLRVTEIRGAARLHVLRNLVQHDAEVPSPDAIETARARALAFLTWLTETFFDVEFDKLSRASLVRNDGVRTQLEQAERYARDDLLEFASQSLAVAFELARIEFRTGQTLTTLSPLHGKIDPSTVDSALSEVRRGGDDPYGLGYRNLKDLFRGLAANVTRLIDRVEALSLGARASEYEWFLRNFPRVGSMVAPRGRRLYTYPISETISHEIYGRGYDFVLSAALHWQQFPQPAADDDASEEPQEEITVEPPDDAS